MTEYQEHSGAVNTSTSVNVQYKYADGSSNTIRPTALVYPNGRVLTYYYGTAGGMDDALSRVASLIDSDGVTHLVDYTHLGASTFVQQTSPQPQIAWSLINGGGNDPYTGFDQFNRVVDNRWYDTASNSDLDRIQHGYDRAGNRLWRKNTVAEAAGVYLDELYSFDGLYRLAQTQRGQLNGSNNGIVAGTLNFAQAWGLDATGNWSSFWENDAGSSWNLQQTRAASRSNEITAITGSGWAQPVYDAAGNMVNVPQPASPASSYSAIYDTWNRLVSLSSGGSLVGRYAYDGVNRRIAKFISENTRHYYCSDQWQDLEERLGTSASPDRQFVWGLRYIDDLVHRDRGTERFYALQDGNWNLTAIAGPSGTISERYGYAAFGEPIFYSATYLVLSSSAYDWETLFAGYRWDAETMRFAVRRRNLESLLGVWSSRDPAGGRGSPTNLYLFASDNPVRFVDPRGLAVVDAVCTHHWESVCVEGYASGTSEITIPVVRPPAKASSVCPSGWSFAGWMPLKGDEARLAKICATLKCPRCKVADCEKVVATLITAARKTTVFPFWIERCQAWVDAFEAHLPTGLLIGNPCFKTGNIGWTPASFPFRGHAVYYVEFCDGTVVYFDVALGNGGWDNISFEDDVAFN